jgi:hypothetical protein
MLYWLLTPLLGLALLGSATQDRPESARVQRISLLEGGKPIVVESVPLTVQLRALGGPLLDQLRKPQDRAVELEISGISLPAATGTTVRLFLGRPDATAATASEVPEYLGYISFVRAPGVKMPVATILDITKKAALLTTGLPVPLTLVPEDGKGRFSFRSVSLRIEQLPANPAAAKTTHP